MNRRDFLKYTGTGLGSLMISPMFVKAAGYFSASEIVIDTTYGKRRGLNINGVNIFKGC